MNSGDIRLESHGDLQYDPSWRTDESLVNRALQHARASPSLPHWDKKKTPRRSTPGSIPVLKKIHTSKSVDDYAIKKGALFLRGLEFIRLGA
jgi:hypothetical protein